MVIGQPAQKGTAGVHCGGPPRFRRRRVQQEGQGRDREAHRHQSLRAPLSAAPAHHRPSAAQDTHWRPFIHRFHTLHATYLQHHLPHLSSRPSRDQAVREACWGAGAASWDHLARQGGGWAVRGRRSQDTKGGQEGLCKIYGEGGHARTHCAERLDSAKFQCAGDSTALSGAHPGFQPTERLPAPPGHHYSRSAPHVRQRAIPHRRQPTHRAPLHCSQTPGAAQRHGGIGAAAVSSPIGALRARHQPQRQRQLTDHSLQQSGQCA
mmetsp:Transcript_12971/g.30978  ORF Transcript_12971/g.30978 Transcript_12971/m.30978 type:complete len:265 (+) Transcript_12971:2560-3354(+)